jgi:hypothetical protein
MSEQPTFRTPDDEVIRLLDEISAMREVLREVSSKLSRLEMRAKRAFPVAAQAHKEKAKARKAADSHATIGPEEALRQYDRMVESARSGSYHEAAELLDQMPLPDLTLLHKEIGLSLGKTKPAKKIS